MSEKRTKFDKLQRNVERLATRDEARREKSEINERGSEPISTIPDLAIEEKIRLRAYQLYEARGRQNGHDLDDWLQAEAETLGNQRKATAA